MEILFIGAIKVEISIVFNMDEQMSSFRMLYVQIYWSRKKQDIQMESLLMNSRIIKNIESFLKAGHIIQNYLIWNGELILTMKNYLKNYVCEQTILSRSRKHMKPDCLLKQIRFFMEILKLILPKKVFVLSKNILCGNII